MFGIFSRKKRQSTLEFKPGRGFSFEIVGEANYQENLKKIAGPKTEYSKKHKCVAVLMPEPNNPHDPNAVRVDISRKTVGYVARTEAKKIQEIILSIAPVAGIQCQAKIVGGWKDKDSEGHFGVKLNISKTLETA
jgi:HIRAN domain-containing protein